MRYRAIDALLAMLDDPPAKKKDPIVARKPTNLPLTQMEPFADSLQQALDVRPSRTRYLTDFFDNPQAHTLRGTSDPRTNEIEMRAGLPRDDYEGVYAHELGHLRQFKAPGPQYMVPRRGVEKVLGVIPRGEQLDAASKAAGGERGAEYIRQAWAKWSGRPVDPTHVLAVQGGGAAPLDTAVISELARMLERSYNARKGK